MSSRDYLIVIAVLAIVVTVTTHSIDFKDCGSKGAKVAGIDLLPCEVIEQGKCTITPGKNASISIAFHSLEKADNITVKVFGHLGPLTVPFPLPQPNACIDSNLTCPLTPNADFFYSTDLKIPEESLKVNVDVEMRMMVGVEEYLCVVFPVIVEPAKYKKLVDIKRVMTVV